MKSKKFNNTIQKPLFPFGGHILNPKNCIKKDKIFKNRHHTWIDAGVCQLCENKKICETYKEWKRK